MASERLITGVRNRSGLQTNVAKPPNRSSPPKLGGVARRRFISRAGVVPEENHPVCAPLRTLRDIFLMGAATPPNLGGERPTFNLTRATFGQMLSATGSNFVPQRTTCSNGG